MKKLEAKIAASILSANFARLGEEVEKVLEAGADFIHFDVMDNHFVPNLTVGSMVCEALRKEGVTAPIDVHLMVEPVDDMIRQFAGAGASYITFHPQASKHVDRSLQLIRDLGCKPGLVLNPATSISEIEWVVEELDMILLMSVNPGFGGQKFIPYVEEKISAVRKLLDKNKFHARLEIDGGVAVDNIGKLALLGADTFVSGSAIFGSENYGDTIKKMKSEIDSAR